MRTAALLALLGALVAVPTVALAAKLDSSPLSISDGRGLVVLKGRGTVIGRVERGSITVTDLTPGDTTEPLTFNCDDETFRGLSSTCTGDKLRFRMIGGGWRISIKGAGIDLSAAISRGTLYVKGDLKRPGSYSVEGVDCRTEAALCLPLPSEGETILLPVPTTP